MVVGNTIRWSDLSTLKNVWELRDKNTEDVQDSPKGKGRNRGSHDAGDEDLSTRHYRVWCEFTSFPDVLANVLRRPSRFL